MEKLGYNVYPRYILKERAELLNWKGVKDMQTKIAKWGNSQGIRISSDVLKEAGLPVGTKVKVSYDKELGRIVISPISKKLELESYLEQYYHKPIEEIGMIDCGEEVDWGEPEGDEIW